MSIDWHRPQTLDDLEPTYFDNGVWNTTTLGRNTFDRTYYLFWNKRGDRADERCKCVIKMPLNEPCTELCHGCDH